MSPRRFINLFPKKYFFLKLFNFLKFNFSRYTGFRFVNYLPITMDVEPTTGCNFRCTMCQVSSPDFEAKNMKLETFKKIIDQNKQLIKIKLQGMGEPFVNKYLFEMINYARKFGVSCEIISNGSLLNEKNSDNLINEKLAKLTISIDGATKNTFEKIRVNSNFDVVKKNVENFSKKIDKRIIRPHFSAWSTIQNDNFEEAEGIAELCRDLGFDDLTYQLFLTGWGKSEWEEKNNEKNINFNNEEVLKKFNYIKKKYSNKKFKIEFFKENILNFNKKCSWPWNSSYLGANGDVVPCCIVADPKVKNMGNINSNSFKEIWNSKDYRELRENIKNNKLNEFCKNCYSEYK